MALSRTPGIAGISIGKTKKKTVENVTVTKDDANDRAFLDADDLVFPSLGAGSRQAVAMIIVLFNTTLANSKPLFYIDQGGFPFNGTGSDVTVQFSTEGIIRLA